MGARAWLFAMLATLIACEGSISDTQGEDRLGDSYVSGDSDTGTDTDADPDAGAGTDTDAGTDADADTDADAGTDPDPDADTDPDAGTDPAPDLCGNGPLGAPLPDCRPDPLPSTGDMHADCVARINQFRWECQCLPPLMRWAEGESCTDGNAAYDSENGVHASFYDLPCGTGARAQNECPGWPSNDHVITGCLQSMWDEGPEDGNPNTVNGHYETMATRTYTRVACGFFTTPTGDVWGVQNFD